MNERHTKRNNKMITKPPSSLVANILLKRIQAEKSKFEEAVRRFRHIKGEHNRERLFLPFSGKVLNRKVQAVQTKNF